MKYRNVAKWVNSEYLADRSRRAAICATKQVHKSVGAAEAHLRSLNRFHDVPAQLTPYLCPFCGCWHVGRRRQFEVIAR
jgi:hypothetical protein